MIRLALLCLFFMACGEVGPGPEFSSGSAAAKSSSSGTVSASSSSATLGVDFLSWRIAPSNSKIHAEGSDIYVDAFRVSTNLITQQEYQTVMGKNPSMEVNPSLPVESVTWHDAVNFCKKLSQLMGKDSTAIRLPTEAQWEIVTYEPVAVIQRNLSYWEWTNDCFANEYPWEINNPSGPPNCLPTANRVIKGLNREWKDRVARDPGYKDVNIGFRVVIKEEDFQ